MDIISLQLTSVFRDCIAEDLFDGTQGYQIRGPGCTVEVDESMFGGGTFCLLQIRILGKRKYQRGRITGRRQQWILGGVCRSHTFSLNVYIFLCRETGECFLEQIPKNKRSKPIMESLILKRIRLGTKILTDGHLSYKGLERLGNLT